MRVTLDVFSGRPNPSWDLSEAEVRQLVDRGAGRAFAAVTAGPGVLGFRGFIVEAPSDDRADRAGLPAAFRVGTGSAADSLVGAEGFAARALSPKEETDTASWLLSTVRTEIPSEVLDHVKEQIEGGERTFAAKSAEEPLESGPSLEAQEDVPEGVVAAACVIQNTPYNPAFWNVPSVQPYNNCYNYAMNYRSNTFAQPGRISGHPNNIMQCANVATAANWDGCTAFCSGGNKNVALVIWPGVDYHWYRLQSNGFWAHKPGSTPVRNTDNLGRVIGGVLNPANCARGNYTIFCGYRYSPTGMRVS